MATLQKRLSPDAIISTFRRLVVTLTMLTVAGATALMYLSGVSAIVAAVTGVTIWTAGSLTLPAAAIGLMLILLTAPVFLDVEAKLLRIAARGEF